MKMPNGYKPTEFYPYQTAIIIDEFLSIDRQSAEATQYMNWLYDSYNKGRTENLATRENSVVFKCQSTLDRKLKTIYIMIDGNQIKFGHRITKTIR